LTSLETVSFYSLNEHGSFSKALDHPLVAVILEDEELLMTHAQEIMQR